MTPIIFWGATGQAKVLRELAERIGFRLVALFDNDPNLSPPFPDVPLYVGPSGFRIWHEQFGEEPPACLVAVGGDRARDRVELQSFLEEQGCVPVSVIHPSAFVAADAGVGCGSQILAQAALCAGAAIGRACIVNTAATVDHDCILGDGVHLGPGVTLAGCVSIGDYSFIGASAVVLPGIRIGRDAVVGAGSVVTRNVPTGVVVYGNPARYIRDSRIVG